jgi:phosphatidylserine/phosphatidylglycerophosphate/cardiolipin synthase-like enzyme
MNKTVIFALAACCVLAGIVVALRTSAKPVDEQGTISVSFCPECARTFDKLITNAATVHCALYDVGSRTGAVLRAAGAIVITDPDTKPSYGTPATKRVDNTGLMHNKFCVVNGTTVLTGSYNPTNDGEQNQNNVLVITSYRLARNYEAEFAYLRSGSSRGPMQHDGSISGTRVENYFCPEDACEAHVLAALRDAKSEVTFMTYSFTSNAIGSLLLNDERTGLVVQGICERSQNNTFSECDKLRARWYTGTGLLHHKVFIIDRQTVITGSYNPTGNGNHANNENILIIHNPAIAQLYLDEYNRLLAASN